MPILILVLLLVTVVAIFSVQNAAPVSVSFLFWQFEASLAIIVFITLLFGGVVGAGITSLLRVKKYFKKQKSARADTGEEDR